jgi:transposase
MAGKTRRVFTEEFKVNAVQLVLDGEQAKQVAAELGISSHLLYTWRKEFLQQASRSGGAGGKKTTGIFPGHGKLTPQEEEIRALRRQLAVVTEEREILKKATAFFAKESR